jgi:hypothetical protein
MADPPTPALRWAQAAVSFWLVAFLAMMIDALIAKGYSPGQLVFGSMYAIALLGLWRGVRWGFHLSIWLAWLATLMIWMFLIPMPDDNPAKMAGIKEMLHTMDPDVSRYVMVGLVIAALASTILLIRQKGRFRGAFW